MEKEMPRLLTDKKIFDVTREEAIDRIAEWWFNQTIHSQAGDITWRNASALTKCHWRDTVECFLVVNQKYVAVLIEAQLSLDQEHEQAVLKQVFEEIEQELPTLDRWLIEHILQPIRQKHLGKEEANSGS